MDASIAASFIEAVRAFGAWLGVFGADDLGGGRFWWPFLALSVLIVVPLYARHRRRGGAAGFWRFVTPASIWGHASTRVDIGLVLINRALGPVMTGLELALIAGIALSVAGLLGAEPGTGQGGWIAAIAATLAIAVARDFATYWAHRLSHRVPVLWAFHKVHHSAEVLTPLTVLRKHPIYDAVAAIIRAAAVGPIVGLVIAGFGGVDVMTLFGANAVYVAFHALGANLRHSHIWIDLPSPLNRVFVSPAMHQIHHSRDEAHYDSNFGEVFAVWDWMFGSLVTSRTPLDLTFGLTDAAGAQEQPHPTVRAALFEPLREARAALRAPAPTPASDAPASAPAP